MVDANMPTNTDGFVSTKGIARFELYEGDSRIIRAKITKDI